jgi:hypothetical protein
MFRRTLAVFHSFAVATNATGYSKGKGAAAFDLLRAQLRTFHEDPWQPVAEICGFRHRALCRTIPRYTALTRRMTLRIIEGVARWCRTHTSPGPTPAKRKNAQAIVRVRAPLLGSDALDGLSKEQLLEAVLAAMRLQSHSCVVDVPSQQAFVSFLITLVNPTREPLTTAPQTKPSPSRGASHTSTAAKNRNARAEQVVTSMNVLFRALSNAGTTPTATQRLASESEAFVLASLDAIRPPDISAMAKLSRTERNQLPFVRFALELARLHTIRPEMATTIQQCVFHLLRPQPNGSEVVRWDAWRSREWPRKASSRIPV